MGQVFFALRRRRLLQAGWLYGLLLAAPLGHVRADEPADFKNSSVYKALHSQVSTDTRVANVLFGDTNNDALNNYTSSSANFFRPASAAEVDNSEAVEIYEYGDDRSKVPVILEIPSSFQYGSGVKAPRRFGINILTWYPSFTSPKDPSNKAYGFNCVGYCNGQILISLGNINSFIQNTALTWPDLTVKAVLKAYHDSQPPNVRVIDQAPEFGFEHVFERTVATPQGSFGIAPGAPPLIDKYLYHATRDGLHYDLFAHCSLSTQYHGCQLFFSNSCDPALTIQVSGPPFERMDDAFDIQTKVDQFVTSMIKDPRCEKQ